MYVLCFFLFVFFVVFVCLRSKHKVLYPLEPPLYKNTGNTIICICKLQMFTAVKIRVYSMAYACKSICTCIGNSKIWPNSILNMYYIFLTPETYMNEIRMVC